MAWSSSTPVSLNQGVSPETFIRANLLPSEEFYELRNIKT